MEILGHSQISLTADTYTHVLPSLKEEAAKQIGDVLWDEPEPGGGQRGGQPEKPSDQ